MLPATSVEILDDVLESRGWTRRDGQVQMVEAIDKAFASGRDLIVTAPVGTGKTGGYTLPAIRIKNAIVCTSTKALQDQIRGELEDFTNDVAEKYGETVTWKILKGQSNYINHIYLGRFLSRARQGSFGTKWKEFEEELDNALEATNELADVSRGVDHEGLLSRIPFSIKKHFTQDQVKGFDKQRKSMHAFAVEEARMSDIVVMNTALLVTEANKGEMGLIAGRELVVFDEAHHANDIVVSNLSVESPLPLADKVAQTYGMLDAQSDIASALRTESQMVDKNGDMVIVKPKVTRRDLAAEIEAIGKHFDGKEHEEIKFHLAKYKAALTNSMSVVGSNGNEKRIPGFNLNTVKKTGNRILIPFSVRYFRSMIDKAAGETVSPVIVMCSGTVTKFDGRLIGVNKTDHEVVPTPFDPRKVRLFIPSGDSLTGNFPSHSAAALKLGVELVTASRGDALVLTTAIDRIDEYRAAMQAAGFHTIVGNDDKAAAIEEFKNTPGSVLIGTKSLWEGIDIPGPDLRLVVIDKIMFPIAGDPVVKTKKLYSKIVGDDDFMNNFVRPAAAMVAQGAGRLARSVDDIGGVAILDSRLVNKRYGDSVLDLIDGRHLMTSDKKAFATFIEGTSRGEVLPPRGDWRPLKI